MRTHNVSDPPVIGIVGVCGSGKSTLCSLIKPLGVTCRAIAQEHSYVQDMWQRLTRPRYLVFLDVSYQTATSRRNLNWAEWEYQEQMKRLAHAKKHADLIVVTDRMTPTQILELVKNQFKLQALGRGN